MFNPFDTTAMVDLKGPDDVDIEFHDCQFVVDRREFDDGTTQETVGLKLPFTFTFNNEVSQVPLYLKMWGDTENALPSVDGKTPVDLTAAEPAGNFLVPVSKTAKNPHAKSKYAHFMRESKKACGLAVDLLNKLGAAGMNGVRGHFVQVPVETEIDGESITYGNPMLDALEVNIGEGSGEASASKAAGFDECVEFVKDQLEGGEPVTVVDILTAAMQSDNKAVKDNAMSVVQSPEFQGLDLWTYDAAAGSLTLNP